MGQLINRSVHRVLSVVYGVHQVSVPSSTLNQTCSYYDNVPVFLLVGSTYNIVSHS